MRKNNKRALIVSALSLLLCVSMLVGSTMAWFTDNATVSANKVQAGTLDIELYKQEWANAFEMTSEVNITDSTDPLFNHENWEPGYLDFTNITVKNAGSLAAKVRVTINPVGKVGKLAEVIDVYVSRIPFAKNYEDGKYSIRDYIEGKIGNSGNPAVDAFIGATYQNKLTKVGTLADIINNGLTLTNDEIMQSGDDVIQLGIALKMQESAGNTYQGETAGTFDILIQAAQATFETDSYDDQYDKDAKYMAVATAEDKIGTEGGTLTEDMSFTTPFVDTTGATGELTVNGGGHTVQVNTSEPSYLTSSNNSKVTMEDITITGEMPYLSVGNYVSGDAAQKAFNAELTDVAVKNVKVDRFNNEKPVAAVICFGTTVLNNCDLSGTTTDAEGHVAFDLMALNNSTVTVNGGYVDKAVVRAKGSMIVNGAKINTIETGSHGTRGVAGLTIKSGSEIGTVKAFNYNTAETLYQGHAKITIEAGATVGTLDLTGVTVKSDVTIAEGATVGKVIVSGETVDFNTWKNA